MVDTRAMGSSEATEDVVAVKEFLSAGKGYYPAFRQLKMSICPMLQRLLHG
jgi:hypothetical protein